MMPSVLRVVGALVGVLGALWLLRRRRSLLGRGEALALLVLLGLVVVALWPGAVDPLAGWTGFSGELARITSLLSFVVVGLVIAALGLWGRIRGLEQGLDEALVESLVDRAGPRPTRWGENEAVELLLVMPAYNEAANLRSLLPEQPREILGRAARLVVVDDGSTDETSAAASAGGAWAIRTPQNRGGGFALKVGFAAARRLGARFVITLDADGQHRFEDLPTVLGPLVDGSADLVIGSRRRGRSVGGSALRGLGVRVFSAVLSFLTGQAISDCSSGLRGVAMQRLSRLRLVQSRHHTAEMIIEAARRGLKIVEVPITIVPRREGESKKGGSVGYALRFAGTIVSAWWRG